MKKYLIIYWVIGFLSPCFSQIETGITNTLTINQLTQDFFILKSSLEGNHPDLYLYSSKTKMDSLFQTIEDKLVTEMTTMEFVRLLTPIHHLIGNNHTVIMPPNDYINYLKSGAKRLPFSLYFDNAQFYISVDASNEYILKEGAIIETINGRKISEIIEHIAANISIDGHNGISALARATKAFSRFYGYYYGLCESFEIEYLDLHKEKRRAIISGITQKKILTNLKDRNPAKDISEPNRAPFFFEVNNGIGILTIRTFVPPSNKKYKAFLHQVFQRITEENIESMILDVRNNGGGYPEASDELFTYFIEKEVYPTKAEYAITKDIQQEAYFVKDHFYKHFKKQKFEEKEGRYHIKGATKNILKPKKYPFNGKLYILMNTYSASTTGHLLGLIKTYTHAIFLGEESGGNPVSVVANDILTLVLPNSKIEVRFPLIKAEITANFENTGSGLLPDIPLRQSFEAFQMNKDEVLEQTIKLILTRKGN